MSTPLVTMETKAKAEVYQGNQTCRDKFTSLLAEKGLPNGLLTLQDIHECGYVKDTGFVWLRRRHCRHKMSSKKDSFYRFENVVISYDTEITAYFETNKIKNLTGVKAKEFMIWVNLTEIYVQQSPSSTSMITFKTPVGLSRSFPVSVFEAGAVAVKELTEEGKEGK
ncbi:hypothetical protein ERO13_D02G061200v2 [Gossypium hirsutum]|uniref:Uncharacterized protein n=3 Tax=Gossypium TaxID=3633 RepID=A0A1U8JL84_GOSHI|nr:uncharacterized protein LOC107908370 [Gossypium hirsutum]KAG4157415.1 hypothetical protein ERO13_D02G061200v2 [Gossypium hirsutum]TYH82695.1 hypothetical protein ES332_D02G079500v1 [Gossypium tomentosum]TYI92509.1 hypothetical protein E1A91_D02G075000v1 [Gossypium mustelinum]